MAARKKTQRKTQKKKTTRSSKSVLKWEFPARELHILRIELFTLVAFAIFIFWFMYYQFDQQFFGGTLSAILFVSLYFVISAIVKRIHTVEEKYHLTHDHLEITKQVNGKRVSKVKIPLSEVILHKFDHLFLGAYLVTPKRRHSMFFNSEKESRAAHTHIKKRVKKRRK